MSGIRASSGIPPTLAGSAASPASGQGSVAAMSAAPSTGQGSGLPANSGQAQQPEASTRQLQANTLVSAVVMARTSTDHLIVHTAVGNFRITTPLPFPLGSQIAFEVIDNQDVILARIVTLNGRDISPPLEVRLLPTVDKAPLPAESYSRIGQLAPPATRAVPPLLAAASAAAPLASLPRQQIPPAPLSSAPQGAAPASPPPTSALSGAVLSAATAAAAAQEAFSPAEGNRIAPGLSAYQRTAGAATTNVADAAVTDRSQLPTAAPVAPHSRPQLVTAEVVRAPAALAGAPAGLLPLTEGAKLNLILRSHTTDAGLTPRDGIYQGTVIAIARAPETTGAARITLHAPIGTLAFNSPLPPSIGTTIQFAIAEEIAAFPLPEGDARIAGRRAPQNSLMADWQNLREALNHVARVDPVIAQSVIHQIIPQANARLPNSLLFFMVALNFGAVDKWLGADFTAALRSSGRGALLQALDDDFKSLSRLQSDAGGQDWKSLNFPFFDGTNLRQVRMFYRRHGSAEEDERPETTRFVIELNLTRSGQMQLDGLFKARSFNLAIRSHAELGEEMRLHINALFNEHLSISGLKGQLTFRAGAPFALDPLAEWEGQGSETAPR
ncbi:hypothetical protein [Sneathiella sp.]|uniref:hypothetical protein n=1 Tax=Sneathiella sp. TaxID=1964365 RepID=UPI002FE3580D